VLRTKKRLKNTALESPITPKFYAELVCKKLDVQCFVLEVWLYTLWRKKNNEKAALRMLVKLATLD
jgi:hypothetical protein